MSDASHNSPVRRSAGPVYKPEGRATALPEPLLRLARLVAKRAAREVVSACSQELEDDPNKQIPTSPEAPIDRARGGRVLRGFRPDGRTMDQARRSKGDSSRSSDPHRT